DFYHKNNAAKVIATPSKENPLIYNLLGDLEVEESLILSHKDLFDYFMSLFGNFKLPDALQTSIVAAKHIIFLGFKFEKWYAQLLLAKFDLENDQKIKTPY